MPVIYASCNIFTEAAFYLSIAVFKSPTDPRTRRASISTLPVLTALEFPVEVQVLLG